MNALEVSGLRVTIGGQVILREVGVVVEDQRIVTLLGPNGVGKTTLMRAVSGIYPAAAGSVRLHGREITGLPAHDIVGLGLAHAPEGRQIFGPMSVLENLQIGGALRPAAEVERELERVFAMFPVLRERARQRAGSLSGGEQQMLCIGRALMARPRVLLLDEPSLGLAPMVFRRIFHLIREIRAQGIAVLLVEQNARAALRVADYAYIMEGGRIVQQGTPAEFEADDRIRAAYFGGGAATRAAGEQP